MAERESEINWTAVGSVAAVAAVVIAFFAYRDQHRSLTASQPTAPATRRVDAPVAAPEQANPAAEPSKRSDPPKPSAVPLTSLAHPCRAPDAATVARFRMQAGRQFDDSTTVVCRWIVYPPGWNGELTSVSVTYLTSTGGGDQSSTPASVRGVSGATKNANSQGGCHVRWNTTFGRILVTAAGPNQPAPGNDPCVFAEDFADALAPNLAR
ncbi:DUF3558 family protein [Longispora urticae]